MGILANIKMDNVVLRLRLRPKKVEKTRDRFVGQPDPMTLARDLRAQADQLYFHKRFTVSM